jgi:cytochrome c oxidase assembly protein subunit 15
MNLYRKVLGLSLFAFTTIVFTGALVRLSDSGLGCEDWPKCSADEFVPEWAFHSWVEFGNRLYSGLIGFVAIGLVWATYKRGESARPLRSSAWVILIGTAAQVVVGAVTVKTDLNPFPVTVHFLLSMALVWVLIGMWAKTAAGHEVPDASPLVRRAAMGLAVWAAVVLTTGTIVTGTGPNGGDATADRLAFDIQTVARLHSVTVWILLAGFLWLAWRAQSQLGADHPSTRRLRVVLLLIIAQGGLGYLQYSLGVPPGLVLAHVVGSVLVWCGVAWVAIALNHAPWMRYH